MIRILHIEDDDAYARSVSKTMPRDVALRRVRTMAAARDESLAGAFHGVLLDLHLPDSKGDASLDAARMAFPSASILVLADTLHALSAEKREGVRHCGKPEFKGDRLEQWLGHVRSRFPRAVTPEPFVSPQSLEALITSTESMRRELSGEVSITLSAIRDLSGRTTDSFQRVGQRLGDLETRQAEDDRRASAADAEAAKQAAVEDALAKERKRRADAKAIEDAKAETRRRRIRGAAIGFLTLIVIPGLGLLVNGVKDDYTHTRALVLEQSHKLASLEAGQHRHEGSNGHEPLRLRVESNERRTVVLENSYEGLQAGQTKILERLDRLPRMRAR